MRKVKIKKWKCTVCRFVEEKVGRPEHCKYCNAQGHKIKPIEYRLRRKSHADEPEASHH